MKEYHITSEGIFRIDTCTTQVTSKEDIIKFCDFVIPLIKKTHLPRTANRKAISTIASCKECFDIEDPDEEKEFDDRLKEIIEDSKTEQPPVVNLENAPMGLSDYDLEVIKEYTTGGETAALVKLMTEFSQVSNEPDMDTEELYKYAKAAWEHICKTHEQIFGHPPTQEI